jgi:hypothetical protein
MSVSATHSGSRFLSPDALIITVFMLSLFSVVNDERVPKHPSPGF